MHQKISIILLLILIAAGTVFAQYGKISGTVVDKQSKEPLIGANVLILGTTMGAATDIDGNYVILNVAPGTYDLCVTYVGYQDVTYRNISIISGLTKEIKFEVSSIAIELEPIEIIAERPLIEKSATNAIRILKAEDFEKLPVRGIVSYLAYQPGVVVQNDRIHIRGSRPDEVGFTVDGATTKNIVDRDGGSLVNTIPEALEEVLIQAGGYTAEFGSANAGLIQQNLRTGRDVYHVSIQIESDNFSDPGKKFLGTYNYGYSDYIVSVSGPVFSDKIKLFVAGENFFARDYDPVFWTGSPTFWSDGARVDSVFDTGARGGKKGESQILSWLPGNIEGRMRNRYSTNGTLLFDFKPIFVKVGGAFSWQRTRSNASPLMNLFAQDRLPLIDISEGFMNAKFNYFVNPTILLEANFSMLDRRSKQYDPWFKDDVLAYNDSMKAAAFGTTYPRMGTMHQAYDFHGFPFNRPGQLLSIYRKNQTGYYGGSAAMTSQLSGHEVKLGLSYEYWTARNYGIEGMRELTSIYNAMRLNPDTVRNEKDLKKFIRRQTGVSLNNYGYDEFGREIDSGDDGPKHPQFFSAYLMDKVEFEDLIINAGIRYDYYDLDTWTFLDPTKPQRDDTEQKLVNIEKTQTYQFVSPRLGFSFPVTDRTVFHLQFGKFVQPPGLDVAYRGLPAATAQIQGGYMFVNPISYDLQPTRTTQYEVGFTQQFTDYAAFDITGFYKDIKGQMQYDFINTVAGWDPSSYPVFINGDFATTKGLEFRITLRRVNRLQALLNYTLSDARGTNSLPSSASGAMNVTGIKPTTVIPLLYDQTHRGSVNLDYRFAKDDGGPILENFGLNLLFTFNSGHRFTKSKAPGLAQQDASTGGILFDRDSRSRAPLEPINSSVTPWNFNLDLRLDKSLMVAGINFNVYVYVQNVLNTESVTNVYFATGNAYEDGFLLSSDGQAVVQTLGTRFEDLYRVINLDNRQHNWRLNGFDLFGTPRQIRFGIKTEI
ncbi:MAG: TonB-dependent receptor [Bacteroidota bacterium]|nr:TonB-dependent receptor [Bacteroidota bacterium]